MTTTAYSRAYQQTAVQTSDRNHTLVLLFDAIVGRLRRAQEAMAARDYQGQCENITRAQQIISTLSASLNDETAPELCACLRTAYNWMHASLTRASIEDNVALLGEVLEVADNMRQAWRQAEQDLRAMKQAA